MTRPLSGGSITSPCSRFCYPLRLEQRPRAEQAAGDVLEQLKRSLSPAQLVTLAATVGLANWTNRFNETFGVQLP